MSTFFLKFLQEHLFLCESLLLFNPNVGGKGEVILPPLLPFSLITHKRSEL